MIANTRKAVLRGKKKKEIVMMNLFVLVDRFSFPSTEPTCLKSGADLIIPVLAITLDGDLAPFQPGSCSVCQALFFFFSPPCATAAAEEPFLVGVEGRWVAEGGGGRPDAFNSWWCQAQVGA